MKEIKREKVWVERYSFGNGETDRAIEAMSQEMGISRLLAVLLYNRGYRSSGEAQRFLRLEQSNFYDPYLLKDMNETVDRIFSAVEKKEKIC